MQNEGAYDGFFEQILQQNKGIEGFFGHIFSYLRRRTDFFVNQKMAEEIIVKQCQANFQQFEQQKKATASEQAQKKEREEKRRRENEEKLSQEEKLKKEQEQKEKEKEKLKEQQEKEALLKKQKEEKEKAADKPEETAVEGKKEEGQKNDEEGKEDSGPAPVGNGGQTEKYNWTQTLEEVHVLIPVNNNLKGKDFVVKLEKNKCLVGEKGKSPIIDGEWCESIEVDNSLWTVETSEGSKFIHLSLEKLKYSMHWWECVIKGDPKIDTKKINPEPSKLSDLDGEMKGTVEKMMFDMRQKQMGLPSSDELQKQDKLKDFMKAHPEMDFSKCKFN